MAINGSHNRWMSMARYGCHPMVCCGTLYWQQALGYKCFPEMPVDHQTGNKTGAGAGPAYAGCHSVTALTIWKHHSSTPAKEHMPWHTHSVYVYQPILQATHKYGSARTAQLSRPDNCQEVLCNMFTLVLRQALHTVQVAGADGGTAELNT